ncbi:MAG: YncE family protein [Gammaproteobacteria bacterium]
MRKLIHTATCLLIALHAGSTLAEQNESFVNFESHQFRPVVMSADGNQLFVTNTPDNRIEIFDLTGDMPELVSSVVVGLEPVAIAARSKDEIWVVNHLSDSVSIVDVAASPPRVTRTLLVGDEPRDIVFGGENNRKAFITSAHRGQNSPYTSIDNPGELTTPGIGRADVWVFDADNPGNAVGGKPVTVLSLFGDSPGPLAVTPDGKTVYAGVFKSGNQTTIIGRVLICKGGIVAEPCQPLRGGEFSPGGLPPPNETIDGDPMPEAGLIVKWDGEGWKDELNRDWSTMVKLDLPDYDVFAIDAEADTPYEITAYPTVGTILYAMEVNPATNNIYVANTEAINEVRFEGSRPRGSDVTTVQGHLHETRITVIDPDTENVLPVHLNNHINYNKRSAKQSVRKKSLSMPVGLAFSSDGEIVYVAAKGSDKVAVLDTDRLERDRFVPSSRDHIAIPGGGPAGLVLDEDRGRLYVLTRFDNNLVVINIEEREVIAQQALFNPEPDDVVVGRPLFYNAFFTSSNGESSCASCHVGGDKDELSWDLGDPYGQSIKNPAPVVGPLRGMKEFHPMKGPMLTQTMRGLEGHGALHWRGDRTAGNDPGGSPMDTEGAMNKFNAAFTSLMGRDEMLPDTEMQQLTDFSLTIMPPPNPIRALDDSLTPMQAAGEKFYTTSRSVMGRTTCAYCHPVNRARNQYGSTGLTTNVIGGRPFKIPSHRNTYERAGMFGRAPSRSLPDNGEHMGPQIRGYGFTHDGGADTVIRFASYPAFKYENPKLQRRQIEQYLFAFESNLKPVIGQQITVNEIRHDQVLDRVELLHERALVGDAELVAIGVIDGRQRGYLMTESGDYSTDSATEPALKKAELLQLANIPGNFLTFTAVPSGSGTRIALDRNEDGILNLDILKADSELTDGLKQ